MSFDKEVGQLRLELDKLHLHAAAIENTETAKSKVSSMRTKVKQLEVEALVWSTVEQARERDASGS